MDDKIKKMYTGDCALIISFIAFLWLIMSYVMFNVNGLIEDSAVRIVALGAGLIVAVTATFALVAVLNHLKTNKIELYTEDIKYSQD